MRDINLLQEQTSTVASFDAKQNLKPAFTLLGVLLVLLAGSYAALVGLSTKNVALTLNANAEAATYQEAAEVKNAVAQKQAQVSAVEELLATAEVTGTVSTELLTNISASITGDAFLQSIALDDSYGMQLAGVSPTRADVAALAYKLKETGSFTDVQIVNIVQLQQGEGAVAVYSFSISAVVKGGELVEN